MPVSSYAADPPLPDSRSPERAVVAEARYGALPWIVLLAAAGVAAASLADALARSGHGGGTALFWLAVVLILLPAGLRLTTDRASSTERAATVIVVGLALYAMKVLRDPFAFTFGDELAHLRNLQSILGSGHLFGANSILPVTTRYPGLESVAAAIARGGGISPFAAGLAVIAAARVLVLLSLYLFYERVSGSPRAAGLAALIYTATPTFLFFSAQFSYESLALPLATVALFALMRWAQSSNRADALRWGTVVLVMAAAVIATHHVTSYFLVVFLIVVCLLHGVLHGRRGAPWVLAGAVSVLTVGWLSLVAGPTVGYLSPVITNALNNVIQVINQESKPHVLFANSGGVAQTPTGERVVALFGILLLGLAILAGLRSAWGQRQRNPVLVLLMILAVAYIGTLPLRFVPAAWETASRAGEFLFIGVGMIVAFGILWLLERGTGAPLRRLLSAAAVTIVFASGVIAGWPASERLASPRRIAAAGHTLDPPSVVAALWSGRLLGTHQRVFAENADARLFVVDGHQTAFQGAVPDVEGVLDAETPLETWMRKSLRDNHITLVVTDRRTISADNIVGFFFDVGAPSLAKAAAANKFNLPGADRLYDDGNIVIYGVRGLW
jgi:hypothetical protein